MPKNKRRKLVRESLENLLFKYERRIQKLAENAYEIRRTLAQMNTEALQAVAKEEISKAVQNSEEAALESIRELETKTISQGE